MFLQREAELSASALQREADLEAAAALQREAHEPKQLLGRLLKAAAAAKITAPPAPADEAAGKSSAPREEGKAALERLVAEAAGAPREAAHSEHVRLATRLLL